MRLYKYNKYTLAIAVVILSLGDWIFAQEGYYGQQIQGAAVVQTAPAKNAAPALILEQQKPAEIRVSKPVKVGNLTLSPGEYFLHYQIEGSHHFVRISKVVTVVDVHPEYSVNTYTYDVGDVNCELVFLPGKAPRTRVSEVSQQGVNRITKLEIKGDSIDHVL